MSSIVYPFYFQIYRREGAAWYVQESTTIFYNPTNITPTKLTHVEKQFGLTEEQVMIELFRVNGGKPGYYLGNLRTKKFYYCGTERENIRSTLQSLGIGRPDPVES